MVRSAGSQVIDILLAVNSTNSYIESPMATMLQGPLPSNALQVRLQLKVYDVLCGRHL